MPRAANILVVALGVLPGGITISQALADSARVAQRVYTVCELNALGSKATGTTVRVIGEYIQASPHGSMFGSKKCSGAGMEFTWPEVPPRHRSIVNFERAVNSQLGIGTIEVEVTGEFSWEPPDEKPALDSGWRRPHGKINVIRVWTFAKWP
jgi:hypothetical protein